MISRKEYDGEIEWCRKKRAESLKKHIIERNPFSDLESLRNFIYLEIDRHLDEANKKSIVYDSHANKLYWHLNNSWIEVLPLDKRNTGW